jgi:hypothetical protein
LVYWAFGGRRLAMETRMGTRLPSGTYQQGDGAAFFFAARQEGLETMKVRLRDLQAMAAIALLAISGSVRMAGAQVAATTLTAQATPVAQPATGQGSPATAAVGNLPAAPAASNQAPAVKLTEPLYLRDTG